MVLAGLAVLAASCGGGDDDDAPSAAATASGSTPGTSAAVEEGPDVEQDYTGEGPTVAIVGDSLTASSRADLRAALDGFAVKIAAVRGEGLAGGPLSDAMDRPLMADALSTYALDPPDVLVVALGTNDAWQSDLTPEEFEAEWARLLGLYPDTCLVGVTVTEDAPAADPAYDGDEAAAINERIRSDVDVVVDWATEGADDRYTDPTDTIHLTDEGRARRAELVATAVSDCLAAS
jgi:lysophospholipase L1-like esterase